MVKIVLGILGVGVMGASAMAVEVALTVKEMAGVARVANPVNSGVPLPKGAVKEAAALRLLDGQGKPVLASIEPRARWLGDESLKWVTVHFLANVPANGAAQYRLATSEAALPKSPLAVTKEGKTITVVTGPAKFVVPADRLAPFDQVYVRADEGRDFAESDALLAKPAVVTLAGRNGTSRVAGNSEATYHAELVGLEDPFRQTGVVQSAEIEERGPGRAVVALKGTFSTAAAKSLDFTARLYFYAGSPLAEMTLSVRNRQLDSMARFVGIEALTVDLPLKTAGKAVASVSKDGQSVSADVVGQPLHLVQTKWNKMALTTPDGRTVDGRQSDGWVRLASGAGALTAGTRWFWQVYPMGLAVRPDGGVVLELKPADAERIDLYTAGAKTHFLFFHFATGAAAPAAESIATGTTAPLVAACAPDWYCQETRVFGDLYANNPALFQPQYRDLIARYQKQLDASLKRIVTNRPRPGWKVDEYGWLNFGSGLHHREYVKDTPQESWWDSNYYDFPHAVLVNYLRTSDLLSLRTAEEAGLHLADIDICHSFPGYPNRAGAPRSGPVIGHFRNYAGSTAFMGHDSFTFYKNESLYELYYLTGERWYREVGLMSSDFAMAFWGKGALRNLAHGIFGVLSAYQDTHQPKYLDRARFFVDEWGKPWQDKANGSFKDQQWMYGLAFEAYDKYYRISGDLDTAKYLVRALDALIQEFWAPTGGTGGLDGMNLIGYALGYEYTGKEDYLKKGLWLLDQVSRPGAEGDRVKTFAQNYRASPYFLKVLTVGYKPQPVLPAGGK
jgi:hypothetical protein